MEPSLHLVDRPQPPTPAETIALLRQVYSRTDEHGTHLKRDKSGRPQYQHPIKVMERMVKLRRTLGLDTSDQYKNAALLHDIIEDTRKSPEPWTVETLRAHHYDERTIAMVVAATSGIPGIGVFTETMIPDHVNPRIAQLTEERRALPKDSHDKEIVKKRRDLHDEIHTLDQERIQDRCEKFTSWIKALIATDDVDLILLKYADMLENSSPERLIGLKSHERTYRERKYQEPMKLILDYLSERNLVIPFPASPEWLIRDSENTHEWTKITTHPGGRASAAGRG